MAGEIAEREEGRWDCRGRWVGVWVGAFRAERRECVSWVCGNEMVLRGKEGRDVGREGGGSGRVG